MIAGDICQVLLPLFCFERL